MVTADIPYLVSNDADIELIESLVSAWWKNGQVLEWQAARVPEGIRILALLPKHDALVAANNSVYAAKALEALNARGIEMPKVQILGPEPESAKQCSCARPASLVMFTNYLSKGSPVRCGDCFGPVPLYELPFTQDFEHLDVLHWAADYRACDTLQMHCTTGERFAEAQLGRFDSSLSKQGRGIASRLSALAGVPVYCFLMKARGATALD